MRQRLIAHRNWMLLDTHHPRERRSLAVANLDALWIAPTTEALLAMQGDANRLRGLAAWVVAPCALELADELSGATHGRYRATLLRGLRRVTPRGALAMHPDERTEAARWLELRPGAVDLSQWRGLGIEALRSLREGLLFAHAALMAGPFVDERDVIAALKAQAWYMATGRKVPATIRCTLRAADDAADRVREYLLRAVSAAIAFGVDSDRLFASLRSALATDAEISRKGASSVY